MLEYYECESCRLCSTDIYRLVSGYGATEHVQHCAYGWDTVQLVVIFCLDLLDITVVSE